MRRWPPCPACRGRRFSPDGELDHRCLECSARCRLDKERLLWELNPEALPLAGSEDGKATLEPVGVTREAGGEENRAVCALLHRGAVPPESL